MILFNKKVAQAIQIICYICERGSPMSLREICKDIGMSYNTGLEIIGQLRDYISAERGRSGGVKLTTINMTIADIAKKLDCVQPETEMLYEQRLSTAMNRIGKISIADLVERDS